MNKTLKIVNSKSSKNMNNYQKDWTRRQFLATVTGTGAAMYLNPFTSWATSEIDPRITAIVAKTIAIDTHNHVDVPSMKTELSETKIDLLGEMKKSGLSAICMTFAVDRPKLTETGQAYERFVNGLDAMDVFLKNNNMTRSLNVKDLKKAHKKHKPTVIQSAEGGHFLEGQLERLEIAYKRGLRVLGLLHDAQPSVPIGDIYTDPPQYGGLTEFGKSIIQECNKLGILIDLTHCNNEAIKTAIKVSTKPLIITHTGLDTQLGKDEKRAKMMLPRLISKTQAKMMADAGGVIGVWTHLAETPLAYVQNMRAMVDVVGIDHVCIGTDTKIAKPYMPKNETNDANKNERIGEKTNIAWQNQTEGFYYAVVAEMLKTGFTENDIAKVGGINFCRVFDAATIGH
jgi:membrane dipeptidase